MTENVCYSILKTAAQQIIQSAGFEGANNSTIETLADVFRNYVEALGSSVSAYAQLNGRSMGNVYDVLEVLQEVSVQPKTLKVWLEEEGKSLTPCWSENSDPGRLIQGVISGGRPNFNDMIEYKYGEYDEYDILLPSEGEEEEESIVPSSPPQPTQQTTDLPSYIPNHFPSFPALHDQDELMQEATGAATATQAQAQAQAQAAAQAQQAAELQKQKELQEKQAKEKENFPILVKNRKKPIENPFTHIIPFEDSSLLSTTTTTKEDASAAVEQGPPPISLALIEEEEGGNITPMRRKATTTAEGGEGEEEEFMTKRRKLGDETLRSIIDIKQEKNQLDEKQDGIIQNNSNELFKTQTENAATPGNYLFNKDSGVFDQVILSVSDPILISKLTTPNLQTDIALNQNYSTPLATPTTASSSHYNFSHGNDMFGSGSSMLQSLANGNNAMTSNANKLKRLNQPIPTINTLSKHSVDINAIKTGDSKYIIKKKKMLAEKERLERLAREREAARERGEFIEEDMDLDGPSVEDLGNGSGNSTLKWNSHSGPGGSSSSTFGSNTATPGTIKATTPTTASAPTSAAPKIPTGPISLSSFMSSTASVASSPPPSSHPPTVHKEKGEKKEKKKKDKSSTKLKLNLSTLPAPNLEESTSSPNTPKIRFKIKPPPPSTSTSTTSGASSDHHQPKTNGHSTSSSGNGISSIKISTNSTPKVPKVPKPKPTTISLSQYQQQQQSKAASSNNHHIPSPTKIKLEHQPHTMLSSPIPRPIVHQSQPQQLSTAHTVPTAAATNNNYTTSDEIKCICENPTVDYGTFMIACDNCSVWFHGSCVGIAESDQVEEWYCKRCKRY